jgi:thiamine-phosphate pyrophosphorylase
MLHQVYPSNSMHNNCRLYLISPPQIDLPKFVGQVEDAFAGGDVGSFQLRLKNASDTEILKAAAALIPICHAHEAAFILNDRADLAVQCNADGIHLGQDDMPVKEARKIVGDERVIGVSAHASKHLAMVAGEQGADYVAFGAFYPTQSKPKEKLEKWGTPTPEILEWWSEFMVLPCVAIGGMTPANCGREVKAGADFIAAITYVWNHEKGPGAAVKEFNEAFERAL